MSECGGKGYRRVDGTAGRDDTSSRLIGPGSSNTRALTPPDDHHASTPLLLQSSVDVLKRAFRVALAECPITTGLV